VARGLPSCALRNWPREARRATSIVDRGELGAVARRFEVGIPERRKARELVLVSRPGIEQRKRQLSAAAGRAGCSACCTEFRPHLDVWPLTVEVGRSRLARRGHGSRKDRENKWTLSPFCRPRLAGLYGASARAACGAEGLGTAEALGLAVERRVGRMAGLLRRRLFGRRGRQDDRSGPSSDASELSAFPELAAAVKSERASFDTYVRARFLANERFNPNAASREVHGRWRSVVLEAYQRESGKICGSYYCEHLIGAAARTDRPRFALVFNSHSWGPEEQLLTSCDGLYWEGHRLSRRHGPHDLCRAVVLGRDRRPGDARRALRPQRRACRYGRWC
jgi:hypothetical protein